MILTPSRAISELADRDLPRAFESDAGGTLLLNEVGECDLETQAKLLRVRPSPSEAGSGFRTIRRVGDHHEIPVDDRVIAATNRDLRTREQPNNAVSNGFGRNRKVESVGQFLRYFQKNLQPGSQQSHHDN